MKDEGSDAGENQSIFFLSVVTGWYEKFMRAMSGIGSVVCCRLKSMAIHTAHYDTVLVYVYVLHAARTTCSLLAGGVVEYTFTAINILVA